MAFRNNNVQLKRLTAWISGASVLLSFLLLASLEPTMVTSEAISSEAISSETISSESVPSENVDAGETDSPEYETIYRKGMVSAGLYHTVLLNEAGEVYTWGDNSFGQLGIGNSTNKEIPMKVEGLTDVVMVSAGDYHTLALTAHGDVYTWGRNTYGQLGNGDTLISMIPVRVENIPPMMRISAGGLHSIGLSINGSVYVWGDNTSGQVGSVESETIYDSSKNVLGSRVLLPQLIAGPGIIDISAGGSHSLYLDAAGVVFAWGDNQYGQLGDGTQTSRNNPVPVEGLTFVVKISAGYMYNLVVSEQTSEINGDPFKYQTLYSWGSDSSGQLGLGGDLDQNRIVATPQRVDINGDADIFNDRISLIDAGYYSSVMSVPVISEGNRRDKIYVWGNNTYGQLGIGDMPSQSKPMILIGTSNGWTGDSFLPFQSISAGGYHAVLLSVKGFAGITGRGDKGQLGNVSVINSFVFTGIALRDAISPEWEIGQELKGQMASSYLKFEWPDAADNLGVVGYRLTYINKEDQLSTIKLDLVNTYAIPEIQANSAQTVTLRAIDKAGNLSEFPLTYTIGTVDAISETAEGIPSVSSIVSAMESENQGDAIESVNSKINEIPTDTSLVINDYLKWSPALYPTYSPLEVPWDVDYLYGAGVITPPKEKSIMVALIVTALIVFLFLILGLVNFWHHHKGHKLVREFFNPRHESHDLGETKINQPSVNVGDGIKIIPEDNKLSRDE